MVPRVAEALSRRGQLIIAQRFSVGFRSRSVMSPEGTAERCRPDSAVPSGLGIWRRSTPTLKHWAILRHPSGMNGQIVRTIGLEIDDMLAVREFTVKRNGCLVILPDGRRWCYRMVVLPDGIGAAGHVTKWPSVVFTRWCRWWRRLLSRKGQLIIAQRFSVGFRSRSVMSPEGTAERCRPDSAVPSGLGIWRRSTPTLKHWAILRHPSGMLARIRHPSGMLARIRHPSGMRTAGTNNRSAHFENLYRADFWFVD
jgi:hypothetical protein